MNDVLPPPDPESVWELQSQLSRPRPSRSIARSLGLRNLVEKLSGQEQATGLKWAGLSGLERGETLWWWSMGSFRHLAGRAGYALAKDKKIIKAWLVILN